MMLEDETEHTDDDGLFWCVVTPVAEIRGIRWGVVEIVCASWDQAIGMCDHDQELIPARNRHEVEAMIPMPVEGRAVLDLGRGFDAAV